MFEHKSKALATKKVFISRLLKAISWSFLLFAVSLFGGMLGYHELGRPPGVEKLSWLDSFLNASMILGGMGPIDDFKNSPDAGKFFGGVYALFSGIIFLTAFAIGFIPIFHRFLHKFHIEESKKND